LNRELAQRLNQIVGRVTEPEFLSSSGLASEIAYYIFDYPANDEIQLRKHLPKLEQQLQNNHPEVSFLHLDLYEESLNYLRHRNLLDRVIGFEGSQSDSELMKKVRAALNEEKLTRFLSETYALKTQKIILLSGAGKVSPVIRCSTLLSRLQSLTGNTPVVLFFPGEYDGQSFRIFGESGDRSKSNYYRAFRLITEG
jgi:hypothetical protein